MQCVLKIRAFDLNNYLPHIFSSPDSRNRGHVEVLYMPTWSFDEIKMVAGNNMTSAKEKFMNLAAYHAILFGVGSN